MTRAGTGATADPTRLSACSLPSAPWCPCCSGSVRGRVGAVGAGGLGEAVWTGERGEWPGCGPVRTRTLEPPAVLPSRGAELAVGRGGHQVSRLREAHEWAPPAVPWKRA